jgi:hypothetical protein
MKTVRGIVVLAMIAGALPGWSGARDRAAEGETVRRNQSGGINAAPLPGTYTVVSVNASNRTVSLRSEQGRSADVYIGPDVYDLSKLKSGDRIQVDFVQSDGQKEGLSAATIWPVK